MTGILRIGVCDDDISALNLVSGATERAFRSRGIDVEIQTYTAISQLREGMKIKSFELLLLDIDFPGEDGIAFGHMLRKLDSQIDIIFISNREDRVFDSLSVRPFGFVRKSHFLKDISEVVNSYLSLMPTKKPRQLVIQMRDGTACVPLDQVMYIEGNKKKQIIHRDNKETMEMISSMEKLEKELEKNGFIRIHKGYLVNYLFIRLIGNVDVELTDGQRIPISRRKVQEARSQFLDLVQENGAVIF